MGGEREHPHPSQLHYRQDSLHTTTSKCVVTGRVADFSPSSRNEKTTKSARRRYKIGRWKKKKTRRNLVRVNNLPTPHRFCNNCSVYTFMSEDDKHTRTTNFDYWSRVPLYTPLCEQRLTPSLLTRKDSLGAVPTLTGQTPWTGGNLLRSPEFS